jgi:hypothetical protein
MFFGAAETAVEAGQLQQIEEEVLMTAGHDGLEGDPCGAGLKLRPGGIKAPMVLLVSSQLAWQACWPVWRAVEPERPVQQAWI